MSTIDLLTRVLDVLAPGRLHVASGNLTIDEQWVIPFPSRDTPRHQSKEAAWFDPSLKHVLPNSPRGDLRESLLYYALRDGSYNPGKRDPEELKQILGSSLSTTDSDQRFLRKALLDHWNVRSKTKLRDGSGTSMLYPAHPWMAISFDRGNYKMFNSRILCFLCRKDDGSLDEELLADIYGLLNGKDGDQDVLDAILQHEAHLKDPEWVKGTASAATVFSKYREDFLSSLAPERYLDAAGKPRVFAPEALTLFQEDARTILSQSKSGLTRKQRLYLFASVLYLHLGLYLYRAGHYYNNTARQFYQWWHTRQGELPAPPRFDGVLEFRIPSGTSVSKRDACVRSFETLHRHQLGYLPIHFAALNLADHVCHHVNVGRVLDYQDLYRFTSNDPQFADRFDLACKAMAAQYLLLEEVPVDDVCARVNTAQPGLLLVEDAYCKTNGKRVSKDWQQLANMLLRQGTEGLIGAQRQPVCFEAGQDLLILLVRLACGNHNHAVPYTDFVQRLRQYGLQPQSQPDDSEALARKLDQLNLLRKHSDSGESTYVQFEG